MIYDIIYIYIYYHIYIYKVHINWMIAATFWFYGMVLQCPSTILEWAGICRHDLTILTDETSSSSHPSLDSQYPLLVTMVCGHDVVNQWHSAWMARMPMCIRVNMCKPKSEENKHQVVQPVQPVSWHLPPWAYKQTQTCQLDDQISRNKKGYDTAAPLQGHYPILPKRTVSKAIVNHL